MQNLQRSEEVPSGHGLPPQLHQGVRRGAFLIFDLLFIADFLSVLTAGYFSLLIYGKVFSRQAETDVLWHAHLSQVIILAVIASLVLNDPRLKYAASGLRVWPLLKHSSLRFIRFAGVALGLSYAAHSIDALPRAMVAIYLGIGCLLTLCMRLLLIAELRYLERRGVLTERIAIIGAGAVADRLVSFLNQLRPESIEIVGVFDDRAKDDPRNAHTVNLPVGTVRDLVELGKTKKLDWVLISMPSSADKRLYAIVHELKTLSVSVGLCPEHIGLSLPYRMISYVGDGLPVTVLADRPIRLWDAVLKSAEDRILGGLITLAFLPIMALVAIAVRLDSPGPIVFRQKRHASDNREFEVLKFRSMRWEPDAVQVDLRQTSIDDDRITALGRFLRKTSLDELPQLFNVLKGDMSLVGPRPHAVDMRTQTQLGHEIVDEYAHRHRVKPGMTGWAQVNGSRGATETAEQLRRRIELDLEYIDHWSLAFDFKILFMTVWVVLRRNQAF